jgi:uncharacterized membrane protein YfcA
MIHMTFLICWVIGMCAQLVDGAMGMGFGVVGTTLLTLSGSTPVAAAASVHFAEMGTTMASGMAHWRRGNVDRRLLVRVGVPGGIGAFLGAFVLSSISLGGMRPFNNAILIAVGVYLLVLRGRRRRDGRAAGRMVHGSIGVVGGFIDAAGGGGWGAVATPTLLATGSEARKVVGTVSAAEFMVACMASAGYLAGAGSLFNWAVVGGLMAGGVAMAPVAARVAAKADPRKLFTAIGVSVIVFNTYGLAALHGKSGMGADLGIAAGMGVFALLVTKKLGGLGEAATSRERDMVMSNQ